MQHRVPTWLTEALADAPRGFQAAVARHARIAPDRLSKVLSGTRALKHDEAEALKQAIETVQQRPMKPINDSEPSPEGEAIVQKVVARTHGKDRPTELVFLLKGGGYFVFHVPPRVVEELRAQLSEI